MSIHFKTYSIPVALTEEATVKKEDTAKISKRSKKTNRILVKKMSAIDRKDKKSWQKSLLRN